MKNLHDDIVELFASLGGGDRHEDAVERWSHRQRSRADKRWMERYRREPQFRARHKAAVTRYMDRLLGADRPRRTYGPLAIKHGTVYTYAKHHCRCPACRAASAAYQRKRRARMKAAQP